MAVPELEPGLYEVLLTKALEREISKLDTTIVSPEMRALADAEATDRLSRHLASVVTRAIDALPEQGRAKAGALLIEQLVDQLSAASRAIVADADVPLDPARMLAAILQRRPDGSPDHLETPLTPLLDTDCARFWAGADATSNARSKMSSRFSGPAARWNSTRLRETLCSTASAKRSRRTGKLSATSCAHSATSPLPPI